MIVNSNTYFDATYDVVVLGFGGAGATAARFAADSGAKVLLVDSAPEGHEGGNTRYAGQVVGAGDDYAKLKQYYKMLTYPIKLNEDMIDTFVSGMVSMPKYFEEYLGVRPFSIKNQAKNIPSLAPAVAGVNEYPEYLGSDTYDMLGVHAGLADSALWNNLKKQVTKRADNIDIWYHSPASHLLQDTSGKVIGVQIEREHVLRNIRARNGVVLTTGGFENNQSLIQNYLGAPRHRA